MTDRVVLKWLVPVDDRVHRIGSGQVVHVGAQYPGDYDVVTVWTIEPRHVPVSQTRQVQVYGTGHPLPFFAEHLGSAVVAEGRFVWHVFELPGPGQEAAGQVDVEVEIEAAPKVPEITA